MNRICFVCQAGRIEPKAVLLAASLRAHFPQSVELIAAHPSPAGPLKPEVERALADLDVRIVPIRNPLAPDYPIGHKFAALALVAGPDPGLFLDSDMLAMSAPESWPSSVAAVPASHNHHEGSVWDYVYAKFGLTRPGAGPPTLATGVTTAPYYNSGMIAVPGDLAAWIAMAWIETAARIDEDPAVPRASKRPNLSQLALPVAARRLGLSIKPLDARWNFPGWAWRLTGQETPFIFHYQHWDRLREERQSLEVAQGAADIRTSVRTALAVFPGAAASLGI